MFGTTIKKLYIKEREIYRIIIKWKNEIQNYFEVEFHLLERNDEE